MNKYGIIAGSALAALILAFIVGRVTKVCDVPEPVIRTITEVDTVIQKVTVYKDRIIPVIKTEKEYIYLPDTTIEETNYIAWADSVIVNDDLIAELKFVSPIPLSPKSFFETRFDVNRKTIEKTVYKDRIVPVEKVITERARFGFGVFVGLGGYYDKEKQQVKATPVIGLGITYSIF